MILESRENKLTLGSRQSPVEDVQSAALLDQSPGGNWFSQGGVGMEVARPGMRS